MTAILIKRARELYADDGFAVELDQACYAFDSTTIDLCMALFPWAKVRQRKSAVKLHTLIDLCGNIPCFIHISDGKMVDMASMDLLPIEPGSFHRYTCEHQQRNNDHGQKRCNGYNQHTNHNRRTNHSDKQHGDNGHNQHNGENRRGKRTRTFTKNRAGKFLEKLTANLTVTLSGVRKQFGRIGTFWDS